jgi:hypothetical protein
MNFFFIVLKLLIYAWHLVLVEQIIKNDDLRPLVQFFFKKPHCPNLGSMFQSSDSTYILLSFYGVYFIDPKFGHWQGFKKIYILKVKYYMNKILISENALTKWYLLGSIEFLATLKCLIIICCFLPAEFWQKYAEVSELTGHVRTSGNYGTGL